MRTRFTVFRVSQSVAMPEHRGEHHAQGCSHRDCIAIAPAGALPDGSRAVPSSARSAERVAYSARAPSCTCSPGFTKSMSTRPIARITTMPSTPKIVAPNHVMNAVQSAGARKLAARPVVA